MKKILLLVESPFSRRDHERFGIPVLERFFSVEVFDITAWTRPLLWKRNADAGFDYAQRRIFHTQEQLLGALAVGRHVFVVDYLSSSPRARRIHRFLKERRIPRCVVAAGILPEPRSSFWDRLRALKYRTRKLGLVWDFVSHKLPLRQREDVPDYVLLAGSASVSSRALSGSAHAKPIWAHSLDYDIFRGIRDMPKPADRYVVYADEDLAFHSDLAALHIKPMVTPEKFYPALIAYFDAFEKRTGLKVVIAAHPRSRWDLRADLLKGRTAIYGKTAELMHGAQLVLAHASTSISFAVLSGVPLALLTSDELNDSFYGDEIRIRQKFFGVSPVNIDHTKPMDFDLSQLSRVNRAAYDEYCEKYIKTAGTPDLPSWEIFARAIIAELTAL